jgi:hypothetical protein
MSEPTRAELDAALQLVKAEIAMLRETAQHLEIEDQLLAETLARRSSLAAQQRLGRSRSRPAAAEYCELRLAHLDKELLRLEEAIRKMDANEAWLRNVNRGRYMDHDR